MFAYSLCSKINIIKYAHNNVISRTKIQIGSHLISLSFTSIIIIIIYNMKQFCNYKPTLDTYICIKEWLGVDTRAVHTYVTLHSLHCNIVYI